MCETLPAVGTEQQPCLLGELHELIVADGISSSPIAWRTEVAAADSERYLAGGRALTRNRPSEVHKIAVLGSVCVVRVYFNEFSELIVLGSIDCPNM